MGTVEFLSSGPNSVEALRPLEARIVQCEEMRLLLTKEVSRLLNDTQAEPGEAQRLLSLVLDFETTAIAPARLYARAVHESRETPQRSTEFTVSLNSWIQAIEQQYHIEWNTEGIVSATVMPFRRENGVV